MSDSLKDKCTIIPANRLIRLMKCQTSSGVRSARLERVCCVLCGINDFHHFSPLRITTINLTKMYVEADISRFVLEKN